MPGYAVRQPDGQLAVWSTIVDHFVLLDATPEEAATAEKRYYVTDYETLLEQCRNVQATGELPFAWMSGWADNLAWALALHGEQDETIRLAMERTPEPERSAIRAAAAAIRAEWAADEEAA